MSEVMRPSEGAPPTCRDARTEQEQKRRLPETDERYNHFHQIILQLQQEKAELADELDMIARGHDAHITSIRAQHRAELRESAKKRQALQRHLLERLDRTVVEADKLMGRLGWHSQDRKDLAGIAVGIRHTMRHIKERLK